MSVAGLAMMHGVNANQLRRWMKLEHLRGTPPVPALLPITVCELPTSGAVTPLRGPIIEIDVAGTVVHVPATVDEQHLRTLPRALHA